MGVSSHLIRRSALAALLAAFSAMLSFGAGAYDAEVVSLIGKGDARESAQAPWRPTAVRAKLLNGNFVRTHEYSQMGLLIGGGTQLRLNQLSILQIKSVSAKGPPPPTQLELPRGRVWAQQRARTPEPAARAPALEIRTPGGVIGIRGTDWEVVVEPDGVTTVTVVSGEADLANERGRVRIGPNEQGRAAPGRAPVKVLLTSAADRVQWVTAWRPQPRRWVKDLSPGLETAAKAIEAEDFGAALRALAGARGAGAVLMRADLHVFFGEVAQAVGLLEPLAAQDGRASALLARAQLAIGAIAQAARVLEEAGKLHADEAEVLLAQAELARLQGDADAARGAARRVLEREPQNAEAWFMIGRIETEREFAAAAREALGRALELQPAGPGYRGELGTLETFANDFDAAEAAFRGALEAQPADYAALTGLGVLQLKRGETEAALESFLKAGVIEPRYARAWVFTGVAQYQLGERERALEAFAKAAALDERDPLPHLVASLVHLDALELGRAIEAAREAQARMPFLRSLNQVLSDQKGSANLGAALGAFGLEEWSRAYAYDAYSPYWAGSHLFLADRLAGSFNKNSELFKGFLSDPAVFGASNRFSSIAAVPGHYAQLGAGWSRDFLEQASVSAAVNGYSVAGAPLSYYAGIERRSGESAINRSALEGRGSEHSNNAVLGLGLKPSHELGLFAFGNLIDIAADFDERASGIAGRLDQPYRRYDAGFNYKFSPTSQAWLKAGLGSEEAVFGGTATFTSGPLLGTFPLGLSYDLSQRDIQWRHTSDLSKDVQFSWGLEYSRERKPLAFTLAPPLIVLDQNDRIGSALAYAALRAKLGPALEAQVDLHYQRTRTEFLTVLGASRFAADVRELELNPRLGIAWRPAEGHTVRAAAQAWRRPPGVNTLAPVDTLGIVLDDRVVRAGGLLTRVRLQHEVALGRGTFFEWFLDAKRVRHPVNPGAPTPLAITLVDLERLRARPTVYAPRREYLEDDPEFGEGRIRQAGIAFNRLLSRDLALVARYVHASTENTGPAFAGNRIPFHPRHYLDVGLNWQPAPRWIVGPFAAWRSLRYGDEANKERLESGWSLGLGAWWESEDKRWSVSLLADQLNSARESSIYRRPLVRLLSVYRF